MVTERHPALHAARGLLAQLRERQGADELAEVADALRWIALRLALPRNLFECTDATHQAAAPSLSRVNTPIPPAESGRSSAFL